MPCAHRAYYMSYSLVLGSSTSLNRPFLKSRTLANKALGYIKHTLPKPLQRKESIDLLLLWLLIGTPSAIRPELATRETDKSLLLMANVIYSKYYFITFDVHVQICYELSFFVISYYWVSYIYFEMFKRFYIDKFCPVYVFMIESISSLACLQENGIFYRSKRTFYSIR